MKHVQAEKNQCCGCTACAAVCPVGAITMRTDEEGFLYPAVDSALCVDCGKCREVCAFTESYPKAEPRIAQRCVAAVHTDAHVRVKSRSGGVFYALAMQILGEGGTVYGVALDDALCAHTVRVAEPQELARLQGSKYVQSDKQDAYRAVRADLAEGRTVLFSGTGCEVAGLLSYLAKTDTDTSHLYTCDLVCHGTPSPLIWQENLALLAKKHGRVHAADFRDKRFGWHPHIESYVCEGRTRYHNLYTSLFYRDVILRPACHNCHFCNTARCADLTLADFWGVGEYGLGLQSEKGVSLLLLNTEKGERLLSAAASLAVHDVGKLRELQPNLRRPTPEPPDRAAFWECYRKHGFRRAAMRFYKPTERAKLVYHKLRKGRGKP